MPLNQLIRNHYRTNCREHKFLSSLQTVWGIHRIRFHDPAGTIRNAKLVDGEIYFATGTYDLEAVDVLPPVQPSKIVCVGLNQSVMPKRLGWKTPDARFCSSRNQTCSPRTVIPSLLLGKKRIDYEAELGVVIAEQCQHVSEAEAMDMVAGFTVPTTSQTATTKRSSRTEFAGRRSTTRRRLIRS